MTGVGKLKGRLIILLDMSKLLAARRASQQSRGSRGTAPQARASAGSRWKSIGQ